jgi:predicted ribonuclease YlaK
VTGNLRPLAAAIVKGRQGKQERRIFVLDTNVLMHDPTAIFRFEEHDIYIPMTVLEELDAGKKACRNRRAMCAKSAAFSTN